MREGHEDYEDYNKPEPELLPCPFCGSTGGIALQHSDGIWHVGCWNTPCVFKPGSTFKSEEDAVKWWNIRGGQPA